MRLSRMLRVWLCLGALALTGWAIAQADCHSRGGHQRVVLFSSTDDPDVFVWDSRFRLSAYQSGSYDVDRALAPHAFLVSPGTRAIVISCIPGFVHPKYRDNTDDAVGILIVSGPNRGRSGWIMGEDTRTSR
jgi:hypothetical protein